MVEEYKKKTLLSPLSGLEFVYAQTPYSMRGTMIGMFFLTRGLFSTLAAILLFIFSVEDISPKLSASQSCAFCLFCLELQLSALCSMLVWPVGTRTEREETLKTFVHFIDSYTYTNGFYAVRIVICSSYCAQIEVILDIPHPTVMKVLSISQCLTI